MGTLSLSLALDHLSSPTAEAPPSSDAFLSWKQPGTKVFHLSDPSPETPPGQEKKKKKETPKKPRMTSAEIDISVRASTVPLAEVPDSDI